MTIIQDIMSYVSNLSGVLQISPDDKLFEDGLLTSIDALDLIAFLEDNFNITIPDDDIEIETLGTINSIATLINKLKH